MEVVSLHRDKKTARLRLKRRDKSVNVLDEACLTALETQLQALEEDPPPLLVIESGIPDCFVAGADLDVIAAVSDAEEAEKLAERGQALMRRIEDLPSVSIAVVAGAAMGGGLELALACDYIIAVHGEKTRLALPEIRLGIHPGFGGCVRLPRRIGWPRAVDMILSGRSLDARKSRRWGLTDIACHGEQVEQAVAYLASRGKARHQGVRPAWLRLWPARRIFFDQVRRRALARFKHLDVGEAYPAVPATIDLLQEIIALPEGLAYAREAQSLGRLIVTPTCKNLIHVFHLGESLKKQEAVRKGRAAAEGIGRVAVFGAGVMGSGIAWVASKNCAVDLHEVDAAAMSRGMKALSGLARRDPKRLQRIRPVLDQSGLKDAQAVIEAVLEDLEVKNALWRRIEANVPKDALLLTNTSSLSVGDMQKVAGRPARMAGMHFFNPAPKMPLVEVVAGPKTGQRTLHVVSALAARWGKYPVIVADRPGFLVNRCLMPYMVSALRLLDRGQRPEHVDGVLKHFGMPMGAFELADRVGLDICLHVGEHLAAAYGAHQALPQWFSALVEAGHLGEKSGAGFFTYTRGRRQGLNPELTEIVPVTPRPREEGTDADVSVEARDMSEGEIVDACLLPMLAEALTCLREGVVSSSEHLDAAMIFGLGFPPFRGGLLRHFRGQDVKELGGRMKALGLTVDLQLLETKADA